MLIRALAESDVEPVLALNAASVQMLSPMDDTSFSTHLAHADIALACEVDGDVAAFALAYGPGATYDSVNYRWFSERYDDFVYLDRIVVGETFRRRGIATNMYDAAEAQAQRCGRMVCEVSSDPPNTASLAFHRRRGYREVGTLRQPDGHQTLMLEKLLY